jgi:hypothetical protein
MTRSFIQDHLRQVWKRIRFRIPLTAKITPKTVKNGRFLTHFGPPFVQKCFNRYEIRDIFSEGTCDAGIKISAKSLGPLFRKSNSRKPYLILHAFSRGKPQDGRPGSTARPIWLKLISHHFFIYRTKRAKGFSRS